MIADKIKNARTILYYITIIIVDADVMLLAMMLQEMKNEDVRKVAIEQVKVLARLNKEA